MKSSSKRVQKDCGYCSMDQVSPLLPHGINTADYTLPLSQSYTAAAQQHDKTKTSVARSHHTFTSPR